MNTSIPLFFSLIFTHFNIFAINTEKIYNSDQLIRTQEIENSVSTFICEPISDITTQSITTHEIENPDSTIICEPISDITTQSITTQDNIINSLPIKHKSKSSIFFKTKSDGKHLRDSFLFCCAGAIAIPIAVPIVLSTIVVCSPILIAGCIVKSCNMCLYLYASAS